MNIVVVLFWFESVHLCLLVWFKFVEKKKKHTNK